MQKIGEFPAEKLMTKKFPRIKISDKIPEIMRLLVKGKSNVLPVFFKRKFIGEIHEIDLLKLAVNPKEIPEEEVVTLGFGLDMGYFAKTAGDLVRKHEITISPKTKIKEAAFIMVKEDVKSLPVVKNKRFLGILRERDIIKAIMKRGLRV